MITILICYLWLCLVIGIAVASVLAWEDITGRVDPKFGYNYGSMLPVTLVMIFASACPVLNFFTAYVAYVLFIKPVEKK